MRLPTLGANAAVFILFFGMSLITAIRLRTWVIAALWLALGFVFLWADVPRRASVSPSESNQTEPTNHAR
ncbi:MAG: hypothetical protein V4550_14570 [Gemmatimonadota bacterium]